MISVRPAHHTDFEAVAGMMSGFMALHHSFEPDQFRPALLGFTEAIFQTWLAQKDELHIVGVADESVVGYTAAGRWPGQSSDFGYPRRGVFIYNLVVAPEARRKGVGRALFAAVEAWAADFNAEYVGLNVNPANDTAKAFYEALGYTLASEYRSKTLRHVTRMSPEP